MYYSLHNHTDFSNASCGFMDSINKTEDLINHAYNIGLSGVAITDHESVSAHVRAVQHYKRMVANAATDEEKEKVKNFRLLLGNEIYLARPDLTKETHKRGERFFHFLLVAKNKEGQKQLRELSSRAWGRGYYMAIQRRYNINTDFEEVVVPNRGNLIATSACLGGPVANFYQTNTEEDAVLLITQFMERLEYLFGAENVFLEIAPSKFKDQINYNKFLYKHFKDRFRFVVTTDSHYLDKNDFDIFRTILKTNDGEREVDEFYKYSHMMTWEEIVELIDYLPSEFLESCRLNTIEIGESAEFYDLKETARIPKVPLSNVEVALPNAALDYEFIKKFNESPHPQDREYILKIFEKFDTLIAKEDTKETLDRIDLELSEVWGISEALNLRMSDYLLTIAKAIDIMWTDADSIVGPGRGSAVAFITNYLLGITQLNPLKYPVAIPHWRFISAERPDLPDIDIDTAGNKRAAVLQAISSYFESIGGSLTQICTYGTEGARNALRVAARGLKLDDEIALYASSLVPSERGIQASLSACMYGDEDHQPVTPFVNLMENYPELWQTAQRVEGLITRLGVHAAGVILSNDPITEHNSLMRTSKGALVTAFDLHDSEYLGGVKYDFLSIDGLGKIHTALNFLLKDNLIEWQGTLFDTYKKYLWPDTLKYSDELWENIAANKINSLWQLNTDVGQAALASIHATSLAEIGAINSLMRLQPQNRGDEQPLRTFERYRSDISLWYEEMRNYKLTQEEIEIMEEHLKILYGVSDTQESVMQITMDPRIAGFSVVDANTLRKGIAKKSMAAQEEAKKLFFEKGQEAGTNLRFLNYIWNVQISRQLGYSFSLPHVAAYSIIAIQQANLFTYYPEIYWNAACLSIDAGANQEEDLEDLIKLGYIKPSMEIFELEEEEVDEYGIKQVKTTAIDRGKVAYAISSFQKTIEVEAPEINTSGFGFMPDLKHNTITCGFKIVGRIGDQLINNIIFNRPYVSFDDFIDRVNISKDRVVNLIKAGVFRHIDDRSRMELLEYYVRERSDLKKRLTLQNLQMLIKYDLIPKDQFDAEIRLFNWIKYVRKTKHDTYFILDERALNFYEKILDQSRLVYQTIKNEYTTLVPQSYVESYYKSQIAKVRTYITQNQEELLNLLNEQLFLEEWQKYKMDNNKQGEMQSMRIYISGHELQDLELNIPLSEFDTMQEAEENGQFFIDGKYFPRYFIRHIVGTVVDKNKLKRKITVLTPHGPAEIKVWKDQFAHYDQTLLDPNSAEHKVLQESFFEIGTHLLLTGIKRGNNFILKKYRGTPVEDVLMKINFTDEGVTFDKKIKQEDIYT